MSQDERHYNSKTLTVIFTVSSIVLLISIIWMTYADYAREYKKYQRDFQEYEIVKTRVKFDEIQRELENDSTYQELQKQLESAQASLEENCPDIHSIQEKIDRLEAEDNIIQQQYKFAKAELDAAKYRLEEALLTNAANLGQTKSEFTQLQNKVEQLKLKTEESTEQLETHRSRLASCKEQIKELQRKERSLSSRREILSRKLSKIDPANMSFINRIANIVRDMPILDLANPQLEVKQIVLKDIRDDVNFMTVPKVDRCISCHLGIADPDYKDAPQPFTTHPNLELMLNKDSPHPMEEFGCTVCHGGRGRATDFNGAAHTPNSKEQEQQWKEKYDWHRFKLWEEPMLPLKHVEAGCFKCHSGKSWIEGAPQLNYGLQIVEAAGCYTCHKIDKYEDWPKPGPNLAHIDSKMTREFAFKWIKSPHAFRSDTWMPAFFGQTNNDSPDEIRRTDQEILAMIHYLFNNSTEYALKPIPVKGNAEEGEKLVKSVGCMACHEIHAEEEEHSEEASSAADHLRQEFGPNLHGLGSKTTKEWIYNWIKDPKSYHQQTRMPDLRLSDQEAADIAEFLHASKDPNFESHPVAQLELPLLNKIVLTYLLQNQTHDQAQNKLELMTQDEKLEFAGQKLIRHYGCFGCHNIPGFEDAKPIGTELTEEGSKDIHKLDFGFVHIEHTKWAWFKNKMRNPRIFDKGAIKQPYEKLKMPNFYFSEEEIDALVTVLMGLVEKNTVQEKIPKKDAQDEFIEAGQEIVQQFNCQSCHIIEGRGGSIQESVKEYLMEYQDRSEADAESLVTSFSPPNLIGEGKKVKAQWLFEFLHQPVTIRPWLKVRMPTYGFNAAHLNALVKYFNALDNTPFPFTEDVDVEMNDEELKKAEKLFSNEYFGCAKCHIVGDKLPEGSPDSWAPNFALTKSRLKPGWIIEWLKNPQKLLPGTKMPTYFDPDSFDISGPEDILNGDENKQIIYLRNYLLTLSEEKDARPKPTRSQASQEPITVESKE